ncbi:MAG: lamin tail domain-containing protein, partial [Bacteroidales bacterium]|nr:lamin tail domain-containing protein [Bacteroidales bacterium]
ATALLRSLMRSSEFRRDYMNATADRLNTTLSPKNIRTKIDSVYSLIEEEMPSHIARWDYNWQEGWFDQMKSFGQRREAIMRRQTEEFFSTNGSYTLTLNLSEQGAGKIHLNTIDVKTFPWSGKYFKNNTIFVTAIPNPGYEFVRWEGAVNSTEQTISVTTAEATSLTAVFNYVGNEPQLRFTEVYYHIYQDDETEWIELLNEGESAVDLSNWNITIDRYNQSFTIPVGISIQADSMLVFANDANAFRKQYQNEEQNSALGNLNMKFPKDFATITLQDQNGYTVASMTYSDEQRYAQKADGYGYSYELDKTGTWRSYTYGGTPMKPANLLEEDGLEAPIISEINYASADKIDSGDWIELYNPNETAISLKDWLIQDKGGQISVIYDAVIIPPQGYVVFADNLEKFHSVFPNVTCYQLDLSLNRYVDAVKLYNQYEIQVDEVSYSMFDTEWTKGAFETGRTLSLTALEANNAKGSNWKPSRNFGTPGKKNDFYVSIPEIQYIVETYPNPCSDVLYVSLDGAFSYELISVTGQRVLNGVGEQSTQISVSEVLTGTYLLIIRHNGKSYVKSVVVQ